MSIFGDPRRDGTEEEREAWERDLAWEFRGTNMKKIPIKFATVPAEYGDVKSPDLPECDGEFDEDRCDGCSEYEECERIWNV